MANNMFEFADRFGVESPFDNWVPGKTGSLPSAKIVHAVLNRGMPLNRITLQKTVQKNNAFVLRIRVEGYTDKVEVESGGNKRTANAVLYDPGMYEVYYENLIPAPYQSKDFIFKIRVYDVYVKTKVADMKVLALHVDLDSQPKEFNSPESKRKQELRFVIDPGHGYTEGLTGAACSLYTHKIKGEDGKPLLDEANEFKTETNDIMHLPEYVMNDPDDWVVSKKEDYNYNERGLVFDVAQKLKKLLEKNAFTCFITRDQKVQDGVDGEKTRQKRIKLSNTSKADYFISIHADGSVETKATGAHVIYEKTTDLFSRERCMELATDIFQSYNVVNVDKLSPKEDIRGLQVLNPSNLAKRKVLVELGFMTSPKDANLLFSNIDRIAAQLFDGIMVNVDRNFGG